MDTLIRRLVTTTLGVLFIAVATNSYGRSVRTLSHQAKAPIVDGIIDETEWLKATKIDLNYQTAPAKGQLAPVKTVAYAYEDGHSLHVALYAFDPNPSKLRAHFSDRDKAWGDDLLGIVIDTFNDERGAYEFYVNPMGVQIDTRMKDNSFWDANDSWDAIWTSAASIGDDGWSAEISIPFKALRFSKIKGERVWGFAPYRAYQGDVEYWISDFIRDEDVTCNLCQFNKAKGFATVEPGKNIQIVPTLTYSQSEVRSANTQRWVEGKNTPEAGVSLRWAPTENTVVNATINPDFSQIEADAAQLDINSAYALFVAEKRPFFLDGADYFNTDSFNLVHTRNIADPDIGAKLTGKEGRHSYGLTLANDSSTAFVLPGNQGSRIASLDKSMSESNVAIARYKVDIGQKGYMGLLLTNRENEDYFNTLVSIDGKAWMSDVDSLQYQIVGSTSENPESIQLAYGLPARQDGAAYFLKYVRDTNWYAIDATLESVDNEFRADMGFMSEADYRRVGLSGTLKTYGDMDDAIKNTYYKIIINKMQDKDGNDIEDKGELSAIFEGIHHSRTELKLLSSKRFYENSFNSGGDFFNLLQAELTAKARVHERVFLDLTAKAGDQIDYANAQLGSALQLNLGVSLNLGKHLAINLSQNYSSLKVKANDYVFDSGAVAFDSGKAFSANQSDLRISYQFNIQNQLRFVAQHTDISRNTNLYRANFDVDLSNNIAQRDRYFSTQLVYSYKINAQSLLYLGYADSGFADEYTGDLERSYRSVFAKISYGWQN